VIYLNDFFGAASRRHNDVMLLPAIRRVSRKSWQLCVPAGQCHAPAHRATHVQRTWTAAPNLRPPNSPDLSHGLWDLGCHAASCSPRTDKCIVWMTWNGGSSMYDAVLNNQFLTRLLTSGEEDTEHVSMLKEGISSAACELTMLVLSMSVNSMWLVWLLYL